MERARHKEFLVFVSNLPPRLDQYGLQGIFQKAGRVCDSYIPNRRSRKSQVRFGFVQFHKIENANKSIQIFHGATVRRNRLHVTMAKPKRNYQWEQGLKLQRKMEPRSVKIRKDWRRKEDSHVSGMVRFSQKS